MVWDRVPLTKTPETPAMPSNEKEGKRVDSGSKLSWRCFSGLGLSWCITDGPPSEVWSLCDSVPTKERERQGDAGPHVGFDISNSGFPHRFPRILLGAKSRDGAKPERAPTKASCVSYYMVGGGKESHRGKRGRQNNPVFCGKSELYKASGQPSKG